VPLLDARTEHAAVVRLSRAAGLPEPLPDGLGLALRLPDAHGPGRHQDVLVTSTRAGAVVQHLPLLTGHGFLGTAYSSLVPYRLAGRVRLLGARPAPGAAAPPGPDIAAARAAARDGRLRFELCAATARGTWWPLGELVLHDELSAAEAEALAFDPLNTGGGITPCRPLAGIRGAAYAASRAARPRSGPAAASAGAAHGARERPRGGHEFTPLA
jgi:hypothetical protein